MAPRRSGRRNVSVYKKDDFVEYMHKGSTVTGKLLRKSRSGTEAKPIWVVAPSDRRRKNEDVPEKALGKIIHAEEAAGHRGPKGKKSPRSATGSPPTSARSHGHNHSLGVEEEAPPETETEKRMGGAGDPIENSTGAGVKESAARKRKANDSHSNSHSHSESNSHSNSNSHSLSNSHSRRAKTKKARKVVTFSQETNAPTKSRKKIARKKLRKAKPSPARIGTRSTRGSGALLPELPPRKKSLFKTKRVRKDENVKIVKMLTGTLYLYRGDRPRAEFVRSK